MDDDPFADIVGGTSQDDPFADIVGSSQGPTPPPATGGMPPPDTPATTAATSESFGEKLNRWARTPSPPWLKRVEDPVRDFLNQRAIPEIPTSWVPDYAKSSVASLNALTGMATPANAAIAALTVAQPETAPITLPLMMAPIAGREAELLPKVATGTATQEESGEAAANLGMLLAPGAHLLGPKATGSLAPHPGRIARMMGAPTTDISGISPVQWYSRYGEPTLRLDIVTPPPIQTAPWLAQQELGQPLIQIQPPISPYPITRLPFEPGPEPEPGT